MTDRLERLTNLVATLLDTRRPLTLEEIVELVPGYPDDKVSYRRQFERDKETLRGIGIPVRVEPLDALGPEQGYRILPDEYYLPSLELTADEQAALHVAVTAVRLEGGAGAGGGAVEARRAGRRSRERARRAADGARRSRRCSTPTGRVRRSRSGYRGELRHLDPWGILFRRGHWYVVGHDHDRGDRRSFRVDRIEGDVETGPAGAFEPPARPRAGRRARRRAMAVRRRGRRGGSRAGRRHAGVARRRTGRRGRGGRTARRRRDRRPAPRHEHRRVPLVRARACSTPPRCSRRRSSGTRCVDWLERPRGGAEP